MFLITVSVPRVYNLFVVSEVPIANAYLHGFSLDIAYILT
jgi:hypothetical protein